MIIRPAAVLRELEAQRVISALEGLEIAKGGVWNVTPGIWQRYDCPWDGVGGTTGTSRLIGTIGVMYGSPSKYDITIYRVTVTAYGRDEGWTVEGLTDEALGYAGLNLARCTRAELATPPIPDPFRRT